MNNTHMTSKLTKENGLNSETITVAKIPPMYNLIDDIDFSSNWEKLDNGYLRAKATITQTGIYPYHKLGNNISDGRPFKVTVPQETILDNHFLESLAGLPLTIEHPETGEVTPDTYKEYTVGSIGDRVRVKKKDDDFALVDVTITVNDSKAIDYISNGVKGLSLGYRAALIPDSNDPYKFIQRHRLANHLAITSSPRVKTAQIHLDSDIPFYHCNLSDSIHTTHHKDRIISITF